MSFKDKELRERMAEKEINQAVVFSLAAGATPIVIVDTIAVTVIQVNMVKNLCNIYDVEFNEEKAKSLLASLAGTVGKRFAVSTIKAIPIVGWVIGGVASSALSGASTYIMGQSFLNYFRVNKKLKSINSIKFGETGGLNDMAKNIRKSKVFGKVAGIFKNRSEFKTATNKSGWVEEELDEKNTHEIGVNHLGSEEAWGEWINQPISESPFNGDTPLKLLVKGKESEVRKYLIKETLKGISKEEGA